MRDGEPSESSAKRAETTTGVLVSAPGRGRHITNTREHRVLAGRTMRVLIRSVGSLLWVACAAFAPLPVGTAAVLAQDTCTDAPPRLPLEVLPGRGARDVTLDSPIIIRYSAGYFASGGFGAPPSELITVQRCPSTSGRVACSDTCETNGTPVSGRVQALGDRLYFQPIGGFAASAHYAGVARGVEGDLPFSFCTSSGTDTLPPILGGFVGAVPAEASSGCALPEGGRRVGLRWEAATDPDGSAGSIEYLLFLTRAEGIDAPELRDRLRNFAASEVTLTLLLDPREARDPVCVRLIAIDGLGHLSEPSDEVCVDPQTLAAFQPLCQFHPAASTSSGSIVGVFASVLLALRRSARRRSLTSRRRRAQTQD